MSKIRFCKNCTKCSDIQIAQMGGFINEVGDSIKYCADFVKKICILKFKNVIISFLSNRIRHSANRLYCSV